MKPGVIPVLLLEQLVLEREDLEFGSGERDSVLGKNGSLPNGIAQLGQQLEQLLVKHCFWL